MESKCVLNQNIKNTNLDQRTQTQIKNTNPEIKKHGFTLISVTETQREREKEREIVRMGWIGETQREREIVRIGPHIATTVVVVVLLQLRFCRRNQKGRNETWLWRIQFRTRMQILQQRLRVWAR